MDIVCNEYFTPIYLFGFLFFKLIIIN